MKKLQTSCPAAYLAEATTKILCLCLALASLVLSGGSVPSHRWVPKEAPQRPALLRSGNLAVTPCQTAAAYP